jgi:menaquinone-dependent protoporphyrinogen IX oxidase
MYSQKVIFFSKIIVLNETGSTKPIILYSSKNEKVANEITQELNCGSLRVTPSGLASSVDLDSYDLIFVGTSIHFGNPNEDLVSYLKTISLKENLMFRALCNLGRSRKD